MSGPAWNINAEYSSFNSPVFQEDFNFVANAIKTIESKTSQKDVQTTQELFLLLEKASILLSNMSTYAMCTLSVDSTDQAAEAQKSALEELASKMAQACTPLDILIKECDEAFLKQLLDHPQLKAYEFVWSKERKKAAFLLGEKEETLLAAITNPGHNAWGNLYDRLCGSIKCHLKYPDRTETVGLAEAQAMVYQSDENVRKVAWHAVQEAWNEHRESSAAILNALAGWRHEVIKKRSAKKSLHYLDSSLHENHVTKETLDALLGACHKNLPSLRKSLLMMAKIMKKSKLDPWDIVAASPLGESTANVPFNEAVDLVLKAFKDVDPSMAEFAAMMVKNEWIEGRVMPNKTTGGYCTGFAKSRTPRIYMTYMGSDNDVSTLAHELGHAFHSWTLRDMPWAQHGYPMTLAETASVFAETALRDVLMQKAKSNRERLHFAWNELEAISAFLVNVPARFEFEKNFYEKRQERSLSPDELCEVMDQAWTKWYGPTLSANDRMFWASKLHFSIPGDANFYNYPYTFGYLFSLSIYARRKELGSQFMKTYVDILRDTGRMTAEDLVQKHLGEDIRRPEFWQKSLDLVIDKLNTIEKWV